uniref:30S ribosomal protein S1 n=1 Tax=Laurencia catarinensis TaxID=197326 RepID=UPI0028D2D4DB|nr:30S ribosomal protein S1 [Laurencia catarinensis]WMP12567.1 30S ribosomal protein S1 [Laurencia catarinensis]
MKKKDNKNHSFANILQKYRYNINSGDVIAGTIIHKESFGFLVNIGTQIAGYLPQEEIKIKFNTNDNDNYLFLINTTRDFFLMAKNTSSKQPILSIKRLEYIRAWKRIKQMYIEDIMVNLKIEYSNKGGIITYLENIQGFIPRSQIEIKIEKFTKTKYINCKILSINEQRNQLILSNKSAVFLLCKHKFKLGELSYGQIIVIKRYGLFLNIYGIKALLHKSEIKLSQTKHIESIFRIGEIVKVKIIHINNKRGQLSVSQRNLKLK